MMCAYERDLISGSGVLDLQTAFYYFLPLEISQLPSMEVTVGLNVTDSFIPTMFGKLNIDFLCGSPFLDVMFLLAHS